MISPAIGGAILVALVGWFATIRVIGAWRLSGSKKRLLVMLSWVPWMGLALGAPILSGLITLPSAINLGGAMTVGMMVSLVFANRGPRQP
jgi:hypothetical protein